VHHYEASTSIRAAPQAVWAILTDGAGWREWNAGAAIEGTIGPGETLKVTSDANPGRAFPLKVDEWDPPHSMTWTGGMPLGLFRGVRTYRLDPEGGGTRFTMREEYSGPLLGMIWRTMPDLQPSFDAFVAALRERAERQP
jgi:hypothetical protein